MYSLVRLRMEGSTHSVYISYRRRKKLMSIAHGVQNLFVYVLHVKSQE